MTDTKSATPAPDPMRFAFVEMLFALAITQVAISIGDLVIIKPGLAKALPALSHLILSLCVIAMSWVGWRQSHAAGLEEPIQTIFSRRFVVLLLDVALVVLYFILVRRVEIKQEFGDPVLRSPSAGPEAYWLGAIFLVYLIWDIWSDTFSVASMNAIRERSRPAVDYLAVTFVSGLASFICLALCRIVADQAEAVANGVSVVLLDVALLCVVVAFRVLKVIEMPVAGLIKIDWHTAFSLRRPVNGKEPQVLVALAVVYVASIWGARGLG